MSRFYGSMQGNRGEVTRQGGKASGVSAHVRGWGIGGRVVAMADTEDRARIGFVLTSGSGGGICGRTLLDVVLTEDGPKVVYVGKLIRDAIKAEA